MLFTPTHDEMLAAVLRGDQTFDGLFFTAVKTTGVFCRPSCPDLKPNIKSLQFFLTIASAVGMGYRPCLRCNPLEDSTAPGWISDVLRLLEDSARKQLSNEELAAHGFDPAKLRRFFRSRCGMTFEAYGRTLRLAGKFTYTAGEIAPADPVPEAPSAGICTARIETPIGPMVATATGDAVCLLEFGDRRGLARQMETAPRDGNPVLDRLRAELSEYFDGVRRRFDVPVTFRGTPFQERVWRLLLEIPYGGTCSYEELALRTGNPEAVRAVARANGANRIAILIPCHRVRNKSGAIGGYGGGLWRKHALLELERGAPA